MASVGGTNMFSVRGPVQLPGMVGQLKSRTGVNSFDVQLIGVRGKPYTLMCRHDFTSAGNMKAGKVTVSNMQGGTVTVADDFGNTYSDQYVQDVTFKSEQILANCVGGYNNAAGETRYWMEWEMTLVGL